MTNRTVLIGLDGATFSLLDPFMAQGVMPFLKTFVEGGVRAELTSVIPPLTPPAWTSLATGQSPAHHGIFDFFVKESSESEQIRFAMSSDVHAETVWSMVNRHDRSVTVLNFPLMFPPPHVDKYVVAGFIPWRQLRLGCYPPNLYDRLKMMPGFNPKELAMDMDLEEKAIEGCEVEEYEDWIGLHARREQNWTQLLSTLMQEDPSDLTAVLFDGPDKIQHLCWRFLDPAYASGTLTEWEQGIRDLCLDYFGQLDHHIARIVGLAGEEATVILASDHGFGPQLGTFFVNTWLEEQGYLVWTDGKGPEASKPGELGVGQLARHVYQIDWTKSRAYAPTPSSNGIHIVLADENHTGGVLPSEYEAFRDQLIEGLQQVVNPATNEPVVSRIWRREEVFEGPFSNVSPDLTLELFDGGLISIVSSDAPFSLRDAPSGTHRREGVFIARGPAIRQGESLAPLAIEDVTPLVLYSMGLPVPEGLNGVVPTEVFDPTYLSIRPVQKEVPEDSFEPVPASVPAGPMLDDAAEAELLKRLRALGYVE